MEASGRGPDPRLIERLRAEPAAFEFAQAVRLLEALARAAARGQGFGRVGFDHDPESETVRFRVQPTLSFPVGPVLSVEADPGGEQPGPAASLDVTFLGLVGPMATLPQHYTETVLLRQHLRDGTLRDFLDLFHHRAASFFYRSCRKYRLPLSYGDALEWSEDSDPILDCLFALVGLGTGHLRGAHLGDPLTWVHFAGLYSDQRRSAPGLGVLIAALLGCRAEVEQLIGKWVDLDAQSLSRLGGGRLGEGAHDRLGQGLVLGTRVWDVASRVRVIAGPMSMELFSRLQPGGDLLARIIALARAYTGPTIDCEFVWELDPLAIQGLRLGGGERLGRTAWLGRERPLRVDYRVTSPPGQRQPAPRS